MSDLRCSPQNFETFLLCNYKICCAFIKSANKYIIKLVRIESMPIDVYACLVDIEKAYDRVHREKLWRVLRGYSVNGGLPLVVTLIYSYSERSVRGGEVKLQQFTVGDELRRRCSATTPRSLQQWHSTFHGPLPPHQELQHPCPPDFQ